MNVLTIVVLLINILYFGNLSASTEANVQNVKSLIFERGDSDQFLFGGD